MKRLALLCCLAILPGCELLATELPSVSHKQSGLAKSPSQGMMASYYCPKVVPDVIIPGSAAAACTLAWGSPPSTSQMEVGFKSDYAIKNPNQFPIPVSEMLTAVTVFPNKTSQRLGAACVVFCGENDSACTGQPTADSCKSTDSDIKSIDDFAQATTNLLLAEGIQLAAGEQPQFRLPEVNANSESDLSAMFGFGPDPLLTALQTLAEQSINQLASGQEVTFAIPYRLEGTVWLDVGSMGRVAVGFGPVDGEFVVPVQQLVPDF
jgi:hypothetical protein